MCILHPRWYLPCVHLPRRSFGPDLDHQYLDMEVVRHVSVLVYIGNVLSVCIEKYEALGEAVRSACSRDPASDRKEAQSTLAIRQRVIPGNGHSRY